MLRSFFSSSSFLVLPVYCLCPSFLCPFYINVDILYLVVVTQIRGDLAHSRLSLLPPPHYGSCLRFYHGNTSAIYSLVDSRLIAHTGTRLGTRLPAEYMLGYVPGYPQSIYLVLGYVSGYPQSTYSGMFPGTRGVYDIYFEVYVYQVCPTKYTLGSVLSNNFVLVKTAAAVQGTFCIYAVLILIVNNNYHPAWVS